MNNNRTSKKIRLATLLAFSLTSSVFAQATATATKDSKTDQLPSAKDVMQKYVKATGGAKAYKAIKNRTIKGKITMAAAGIEGVLENVTGPAGKGYTVVDLAGIGKERAGSDGKTYWSISAFTGTRILDGEERQQAAKENDFTAALTPEKYYKSMKVTGIEKVGNDPCFRVELVNKAGTKQTDFYSVKTGLQKKSILNVATPLGKIELPTTYSEYKKAGGLLIPHKSVQELPNKMKQVIEITSVKINEDLADKKFELPEDIVKLQKRAAASGN